MPATYDSLATTTLGSGAADITFSNISSSYTDLRLVVVFQGSINLVGIRFNSDTGNNYSNTILDADGSSARSIYTTGANYIAINSNATVPSSTNFTLSTIDLFSYSGSTNKTCLISNANDKNGSGSVSEIVGLWRSTSAISSITILDRNPGGNNLNTGTTATLYGILKA